MTKVYSKNEWDPLKKVLVGVADHAKIPKDTSVRVVNYADVCDENEIPYGPYPQQVIDEANEDLEILVNFLVEEGIEVVRPNRDDVNYYNFCPRDSVIIHENKSIPTPMSINSRYNEWKSYEHHLDNIIDLSSTHSDKSYDHKCVGNPDILSLNETKPAFDAANVIRANDDLLYLVSNSGNKKGAELLKKTLNVNIHLLENVYSYMHIDSTVCFLREGLMLLNPSRIKSLDVLPEIFHSWDVIWCPEPFDIGYYGNYNNSSPWLNMNLLSISPNLVVIEEHQHNLRSELEKYSIECVMLPMRQSRTLGGGFHCVTLDLIRE
jgi:N-dimethylarginine dimethylaminohydrolase